MLETFFCTSTKTSPSAIMCYNYYGNSYGGYGCRYLVALTVALAVVIAMVIVTVMTVVLSVVAISTDFFFFNRRCYSSCRQNNNLEYSMPLKYLKINAPTHPPQLKDALYFIISVFK